MQPKKADFPDFADRTDRLAVQLGVNLGDLPRILGISRAMFYAYRSGKSPISGKAWKKLIEAEGSSGNIETISDLNEGMQQGFVAADLDRGAGLEEFMKSLPPDVRLKFGSLHKQIINEKMEFFFQHVSALTSMVELVGVNPASTQAHQDAINFARTVRRLLPDAQGLWKTAFQASYPSQPEE